MERIEEEGEHAARPYVRSVSGNPKEKEKKTRSTKMSLGLMGANKKNSGHARAFFSFLFTDWSKKRFIGLSKTKGGLWFVRPGNWRFVRSISKTLCRLHLVVLVDLIMFTHANRLPNHSHMLFFSLPPTSPTHQFRSPNISTFRLAACCSVTTGGTGTVYARQRGARHHAAMPHGRRHILVLPMHVNERLH
jgi:hypothetical protein